VSTDLEKRPHSEALVTDDHRSAWDSKQIALISRTVAKDANPEELHFFLQVAARYNLDPFQSEIYCAKTRGENGGPGRMMILVGEQGRLKVANRYEDYRGYRSDVVCENDRFMKLSDPKEIPGVPGGYTYVEHSYSMGSPASDATVENGGRGKILGGWCEVYREGRAPTFFYAPLSDYMPDPDKVSENAKKFIPWFKTESRMIVKCAISTAFRMAFTLAGIYGEEEIEHLRKQAAEGKGPSEEDEIAYGDTEEVSVRMQSLFAAANNAEAGSYPPAKIRLLMTGLSDDERVALAASEIIPFIHAHGGTVPEAGDLVVDENDMTYEEVDAQGEPPEAAQEAEPAAEG
jgi:phage recombination protein Bet